MPRTFVGIGFGAIQSGLFLYEAFRSGNFDRLVVAEVVPDLVAAVRQAGGTYQVNVATANGIEAARIEGVEILNPQDPADAAVLSKALAQASEICTALPSVDFFDRGTSSVAGLIAAAMTAKGANPDLPEAVVYTAENHNHAAEILETICHNRMASNSTAEPASGSARSTEFDAGSRGHLNLSRRLGLERSPEPPPASLTGAEPSVPPIVPPPVRRVQFLNTVIGKMSGVVADAAEIAARGLVPLVPGSARAFLVEEFNRILISRITLPGFRRGIEVFLEKPDLLPFEEAKLYGHNAVHALLGYLAHARGLRFISEVTQNSALMSLAREAFSQESGVALIARHTGLDPLFTPAGYQDYADDLLRRMTNPWLRDQTERVIRDTPRKLGWNDRLIGTMRLALEAGVNPERFALGAAAALRTLAVPDPDAELLRLWSGADSSVTARNTQLHLIALITHAQSKLKQYGI